MEKKRTIRKTLFKISFGLIGSLADLSLVCIFALDASLYSGKSLTRFSTKLWDNFTNTFSVREYLTGLLDEKQLRRSVYEIKRKRWVDGNFLLTQDGEKRLKEIVPDSYPESQWDGNWYVIIFDVPESLSTKRDILRGKLRQLGFGKLQDSVWISPFNFLGIIQEEVKKLELGPYVLSSKTADFGEENSCQLADHVWRLQGLNKRYKDFIDAVQNRVVGGRKSEFEMFFEYLDIFRRDPRLPKELLPQDWAGKKARDIFQKDLVRGRNKGAL